MRQATATLELVEERTFTARLGERNITGLAVESTWQGLTMYKRLETGEHLIVLDAESRIVTGSPALLNYFALGSAEFTIKQAYHAAQEAVAEALRKVLGRDEHFVFVPARTLPNGLFVPAFQYAKYPCSKGDNGKILLSASSKPWTNITHAEALVACNQAGFQLARESQELSIRLDVCEQDINWTGGKVGVGKVYQGLHLGSVSSAQTADYVSCNSLERSWHQLSTGERVYGLAGNIYTHSYDDIQGDERGLVARRFAPDSASIVTAPWQSKTNGMGYIPKAGEDWSGLALVRGGCWNVGGDAGVFRLGGGSPDRRVDVVGFRCTKSSSGS